MRGETRGRGRLLRAGALRRGRGGRRLAVRRDCVRPERGVSARGGAGHGQRGQHDLRVQGGIHRAPGQ